MVSGDGLRAQLLRGGVGTIALKIASMGLSLIAAVILARTLEPDGYGIYSYVLALVSLLAIPAQFGLPNLVVRETARADANQDWALMRGAWRWAGFTALALSLVVAIVVAAIAFFLSGHFDGSQLTTFAWGLVLVPLLALGKLRGAALRGLRKIVQGLFPEELIRPALMILFILLLTAFASEVTPAQAMALNAAAAAIAFAVGAWLLGRCRPAGVAARPRPSYEARRWLASTLPFALSAGMLMLNKQTDIVMLGLFAPTRDVGVFRVATRGAELTALGFTAVGMVVMPYFARYYTNGERASLQRLATVGARASVLLALPVVIAFIFFGGFILRTVFGEGYATGYLALIILSVSQLVHSAFGLDGKLLNMGGYEKDTVKGLVLGAVCNVILNAILIPVYGMVGAACATGLSLFIWNFALWTLVRHRLGIDSSILGLAMASPRRPTLKEG